MEPLGLSGSAPPRTSRWYRVRVLLLLTLLLTPIFGCRRHDSDEKYFLVSTNLQIPYWQQAGAGFADAAAQLKVHARFVGPQSYDPRAEQQAFRQAVQEKPAGILLHVVEPALLMYDIDKAVEAGIPHVAFDTVTDLLSTQRDQVDAFVCLEAQAGREVATVLSDRHVQDKVVMAMDTDPDTLDWIQKGVIVATIG